MFGVWCWSKCEPASTCLSVATSPSNIEASMATCLDKPPQTRLFGRLFDRGDLVQMDWSIDVVVPDILRCFRRSLDAARFYDVTPPTAAGLSNMSTREILLHNMHHYVF